MSWRQTTGATQAGVSTVLTACRSAQGSAVIRGEDPTVRGTGKGTQRHWQRGRNGRDGSQARRDRPEAIARLDGCCVVCAEYFHHQRSPAYIAASKCAECRYVCYFVEITSCASLDGRVSVECGFHTLVIGGFLI